jgi:hypothetical protein
MAAFLLGFGFGLRGRSVRRAGSGLAFLAASIARRGRDADPLEYAVSPPKLGGVPD